MTIDRSGNPAATSPAILLRESYREAGKVKKRTLCAIHPLRPRPQLLLQHASPQLARSGRRAPNRGNVIEDPLWDRIADGGKPGCQGQGATHVGPSSDLRVKVAADMPPILTAEDLVRIAAHCAYVDERGAVGIRAGAGGGDRAAVNRERS
jgi:hypothetical protein